MPGGSKNSRLYFERQFLTVDEVRRQFGLSRSKIYELMDDGTIPFEKFGGSRRIPTLFVGMVVAEAEKRAIKAANKLLKLLEDQSA